MKQIETKVFYSNMSQAIRLPKPIALPADIKEVTIVAHGRSRIISPKGESWDLWFEQDGVSDDFMVEREQPKGEMA